MKLLTLTNTEAINILKWQLRYTAAPVIYEALKMGIKALENEDAEARNLQKEMILDSLKPGVKVYYLNNLDEIEEDEIDAIELGQDGILLLKTKKNKTFNENDIGENIFILKELLQAKIEYKKIEELDKEPKEDKKKDQELIQIVKRATEKYKEQEINTPKKRQKSLEEIEIEYLDGFDSDGDGYSDGHELRNGTDKSKDDSMVRARG